jgi:hypothetical protein
MTEVMRGMARALCLAAAPVFVAMALLTAGDVPDMMCASHGSWIGGMAPMYLLMSLVHAAPWLRLLSGKALR